MEDTQYSGNKYLLKHQLAVEHISGVLLSQFAKAIDFCQDDNRSKSYKRIQGTNPQGIKMLPTPLASFVANVFELLHHVGVHCADDHGADDEGQAVHLLNLSWMLIVASLSRNQAAMRKLKLYCNHRVDEPFPT